MRDIKLRDSRNTIYIMADSYKVLNNARSSSEQKICFFFFWPDEDLCVITRLL